jgi:probable F420-dependent oxidoreductase
VEFGYLTLNPAAGITPAALAVELEERGFDSLWVPEHSHIPASRSTPYPGGGDLPSAYFGMMNPFVSLATAASVTTDLVLATGVALVLEHDLLDLASQTATLDVLSGGRLLLGIGVGWNVEELASHRPDVPFDRRYAAARERVAALRAAWSGGESDAVSFDGEWDRFEPSYVNPKPHRGRIPIAMGNAGPLGMRHAAAYGDEWCPLDTSLRDDAGRIDIAAGVGRFRELLAEQGRDPSSVPISLHCFSRLTPERLERYAGLGITRVVAAGSTTVTPEADTRRHLDELTPLVTAWTS